MSYEKRPCIITYKAFEIFCIYNKDCLLSRIRSQKLLGDSKGILPFSQFSVPISPCADWSFARAHGHIWRSFWGRNGEAVPEPDGCL